MSLFVTSVIVLGVLVLLNGWLVAAATAIRSVSRIWLRHWAQRGGHRVPVVSLYLERPDQLLLAAGLGLTTTAVLMGAVIGGETASVAGAAVAVALVAAAVLVVGQLVPRAVGRRWAKELVPVLLPSLQAMAVLAAPILWLARLAARFTARGVVRPPSPDAVNDVFRDAHREGVSSGDESAIVSSIVRFGGRTVRDVMTPRADVFAIDVALPPADAAMAIARAAYSRVPVYRGSFNDVVGVVHTFGVFKARPGEPLPVRPVARAGEQQALSDVMLAMLRERRHLAIVSDAAGRNVGLVTLEDLVEDVVGEIEDEHDE